MDEANSLLTLEQQFALVRYGEAAKQASREELEALVLEIARQKMAQENLFKQLFKGEVNL